MKKWVADFTRNIESTDDDARTGRPKTATTDAQVEGINRMVMNDSRVTAKHIAETGHLCRHQKSWGCANCLPDGYSEC